MSVLKSVKKTVAWASRHRNLLILLAIVLLLLVVAACSSDASSAVLAAVVAPGVAGGKHVVDGPLTTDVTRDLSQDLLLNEIDRQVVKIRPMATPIDQLSRCAGAKHAGSMIVDY